MIYPKTSIVVATYNNANVLRKTLNGLIQIVYPNDFEIIVVNDGSTDNTKQVLEKEFSNIFNIKIINFEKNSGVCKARNAGIALAQYEFVVNMDHDCVPSKSWLKDLISGFSSDKIGVVSSYGGFGGTSTAFRKNLLNKVGGYDEDYYYYREDTDLTFKIIELGYEFKLVKAEYFHDHTESKPLTIVNMLKYVFQRWKYHMNDVLLYKKHPRLAGDFLNIKFGFLISPLSDISLATNTWEKGRPLALSSPRGIVLIENKTIVHALVIVGVGIGYMFGLKFFRLLGSLKYGKFLI